MQPKLLKLSWYKMLQKLNGIRSILHIKLEFIPHLICVKYRSTYKPQSTAEYCCDLLKRHDYENFIASLMLSNINRATALAIRSFNVEISRVVEQTQQELTARMRLEFWQETLNTCYRNDTKHIPQHPVALELNKAIHRSRLTKRYFNNLISCRRDTIRSTGFNSMNDLDAHSELSISNVYYLILEGCGVRNVSADHAASHLGKAAGIIQQIKTIPHANHLRYVAIPQDVLTKNDLSQEDLFRSSNTIESNRIADCVYEMAKSAHQHLNTSRHMLHKVPQEARNALLPAVSFGTYLNRLHHFNYNVYHPKLQEKRVLWFLQLIWNRIRNTY